MIRLDISLDFRFWLFSSVCSSEAEPGQTCLYSNSLTGSPESQMSRGANGRALTHTRILGGEQKDAGLEGDDRE